MTTNKYQYVLVDLSLLLTRNLHACSRGKGIGEYSAADVVKMTIQTLNKLGRDYGITADKIILLADTWSPEYGGYYRTWLLNGNYKDSRTWMTQEKLEEIQNNPESTSKDIEKAKKELYLNEVKIEAKQILKTECFRIGLPCLGIPGLEYDDLCYIISSLLYSSGVTKRSVIVTKDSDCMYFTSPVCDYFRLPVSGSEPKILEYSQIYETCIPQSLRSSGLSLFDYKAMSDSLGGGHNDMRKTIKAGRKIDKTIEEILNSDYSGIQDKDLYLTQYSTFKLETFPMINQAVQEITTKLPMIGHIGNLDVFHEFCKKTGITGISDQYYSGFIARLSQRLYSE